MTGLCGCFDWMLCMAAPADLFLQGCEHCACSPALSHEANPGAAQAAVREASLRRAGTRTTRGT